MKLIRSAPISMDFQSDGERWCKPLIIRSLIKNLPLITMYKLQQTSRCHMCGTLGDAAPGRNRNRTGLRLTQLFLLGFIKTDGLWKAFEKTNEAGIHRTRNTNIVPGTRCGSILKTVLTGGVKEKNTFYSSSPSVISWNNYTVIKCIRSI